MEHDAKITLSASEMELVCHTDWILTKHAVIEKVYKLLGNAAAHMQYFVNNNKTNLPEPVRQSTPKISKGENYLQLPYVMLDYPRHFEKENTVAIRTFFWWGNFFSITLQLAGTYKAQYLPALQDNFESLQQQDFFVCTGADAWQHHFNDTNYTSLNQINAVDFWAILQRGDFVKIAAMLPLKDWEKAQGFIEATFETLLALLCPQAPRR
ncbi:MAG TPA: hypothetical protein PKC39_10990 [Ferruginibacter sp.]|nr:hypothetical protein [Ferruginibacter sp.]HMP21474.1 hypothetical protein [Ferruginibacter sp.]